MRKKYSRAAAVKSAMDSLDVKVFNAKFEIFALRCAMQKNIFASAMANDNLFGYKNSVKNYVTKKKENKKIIKNLYLKEGR